MNRFFSKRMNPDLFSLKYFRDLLSVGDLLPDENDFAFMGDSHNTPRLFLGHYTEETIIERLGHYGVMPKLRNEGFHAVFVRLNLSDPYRQEVKMYDKDATPDRLLGELVVQPGLFKSEHDFAGALKGKTFHMLFIHWLCLQNPVHPFTSDRPALPGQMYPGLKIGREFMNMLIALAQKLGMDGIINVPEFPHTALLYSRRFAFMDPTSEGVLKAFQRDMFNMSLAQASWGIITNCVKDSNTSRPKNWFSEEQVLPVSQELIDHFYGDWYMDRVQAAFDRHHFIFDQEEWNAKNPLNEDGSPRFVDDRGEAIPGPEFSRQHQGSNP
jgi:hypothetical protein